MRDMIAHSGAWELNNFEGSSSIQTHTLHRIVIYIFNRHFFTPLQCVGNGWINPFICIRPLKYNTEILSPRSHRKAYPG